MEYETKRTIFYDCSINFHGNEISKIQCSCPDSGFLNKKGYYKYNTCLVMYSFGLVQNIV